MCQFLSVSKKVLKIPAEIELKMHSLLHSLGGCWFSFFGFFWHVCGLFYSPLPPLPPHFRFCLLVCLFCPFVAVCGVGFFLFLYGGAFDLVWFSLCVWGFLLLCFVLLVYFFGSFCPFLLPHSQSYFISRATLLWPSQW